MDLWFHMHSFLSFYFPLACGKWYLNCMLVLEVLDFCSGARNWPHILRKLMNSAKSPSFVTVSIILA